MLQKVILQIFLFITISTFSLRAATQVEVPTQLKWKTLQTEHFTVIFDTKHYEVGVLFSNKAELAYSKLQRYFTSFPKNTVIVINDKTDLTNGYATRIPYPHIMIYPVLPSPEEGLAEIGDWAFEILAHEYAHILTFEPAGGVMTPLRHVFGTIIAPNMLLPKWWSEGLSVEIETRLSQHGRLRSYFQDAAIRALVSDKVLFEYDISQSNESIPSWPEGMRPYLFGSLLWSQILQERGEKIISVLTEHHGRRVPYFIEQPAREHLGRSYSNAYDDMLRYIQNRTDLQISAIEKTPITKATIADSNLASVTSPAISPDGKHLASVTEDFAHFRTIKIVTKSQEAESFLDATEIDTVEKLNETLHPANPHDGPPSGSIQRLSWFPDSTKIIYDKIDWLNSVERFSDLYIYNLQTKKTDRLTTGLRAREPAVSPNGKKIVFVKLGASSTSLAQIDITFPDSKNAQTLLTPPLQERIAYPIFWDDSSILFSWRKLDGSEHLYRFDLQNQNITKVLPQFRQIRFAKKTNLGLLFSSPQNGVLNLYLASTDLMSARPITNSKTAFFTSDLDPFRKEIFATTMTSQGLKIGAINFNEWDSTPQQLPQVSPILADRYPTTLSTAIVPSHLDARNIADYEALDYLWPQYWLPLISSSTNTTGVLLQAQTSGFDPLKKHTYSALASWDTGLKKGSIEGLYQNQAYLAPFSLLAFDRNSYFATYDNQYKDSYASFFFQPNLFELSRYASIQLGWNYLQRSTSNFGKIRTGPFTMFNYTNYSKSGDQVSPEAGGGFYLGMSDYIAKKNNLAHQQYLAGGEFYFSKNLPKHHVLMARMHGAFIPQSILPFYGVMSESTVAIPDSPLPQYILRGYPQGQVLATNMLATGLEYRFPLASIYRGSGTDPFFWRRLSGALIADSLHADGISLNNKTMQYETIDMQKAIWSFGAELKMETTIGYILPIQLILGYYAAVNTPNGTLGSAGISLQIPTF